MTEKSEWTEILRNVIGVARRSIVRRASTLVSGYRKYTSFV